MFVFSNLATSVDGKIATASREHFPLGTPEDRREMQRLRRESDAIIIGATTLRVYRKFCEVTGSERQPANVVISSALEGVSPSWPFFRNPKRRRILCVSPKATARRLKAFEKSCEIVVLKKPSPRAPIARQVLDALEARGFRRVLVEGGGGVMWDFVSLNLIDQYHVTITPRLIGGTEAPTLVDGSGFDPRGIVDLKLAQCRVVGDELYLVYRKTGRRG